MSSQLLSFLIFHLNKAADTETQVRPTCCAVGRADIVGKFFDYVSEDCTQSDPRRSFSGFREAITIAYPFLGMPACIPACYGMIGVIERKGSEFA